MDDDALSGEILPPDTPPATPSARSADLARRISRGVPSADLEVLLHGPIGDAVAEAAGYADDAIAESTRTAYVNAWAHFADWCRGKDVDPDALPLNPVLVAAYLGALGKTYGASALRSRVAAIAYHHRRRDFVFLSAHPVLCETLSGIRRRHPRKVRPAAALCAPEIKQLLNACPTDLAGLRDRALFLERVAAIYSLIITAKLNNIDPRAWLADVLRRINDHPASRLHELLPWNWTHSAQLAAAAA